jgi:hypothetical protein
LGYNQYNYLYDEVGISCILVERKRRKHAKEEILETIKLNGKFTFDDFKKTVDLDRQVPQWLRITNLIVKVAFWILIGISVLIGILSRSWMIVPILFFFFVYLFYTFRFRPRHLQRLFHQEASYRSPFEIEITDEYYMSSNEVNQTKRVWKDFAKWRANQDVFLLYTSDASMQVIPKHFLNDESEDGAIRQLLRENEVPIYKGPIGLTSGLTALNLFIVLWLLSLLIDLLQKVYCGPAFEAWLFSTVFG